jgi:CheY-like chemotaxis protein
VARAIVLSGDLLFGSSVQGMLAAAGCETELAGTEGRLREALVARGAQVLIVDLTVDELRATQVVRELHEEGFLDSVPVLGYYSHVEPGVRDLALAEGFDLVVPRSRMAREAVGLVTRLTGS